MGTWDEKTIPVIDDVDDEDDEDDDDDDVSYVVIETSQDLQLEVSHTKVHKQSWARRWALGCVNLHPEARGIQEVGFTQPGDNL